MKGLVFVFFVFLSGLTYSQANPVSWSIDSNKDTVEITATIETGWKIYASGLDPSIGPVPTSIFIKTPSCAMDWINPEPKKMFDNNFQSEVLYWNETVSFVSKERCNKKGGLVFEVEYMACNKKTCLPPALITLTSK
jgi:hypothetical protein